MLTGDTSDPWVGRTWHHLRLIGDTHVYPRIRESRPQIAAQIVAVATICRSGRVRLEVVASFCVAILYSPIPAYVRCSPKRSAGVVSDGGTGHLCVARSELRRSEVRRAGHLALVLFSRPEYWSSPEAMQPDASSHHFRSPSCAHGKLVRAHPMSSLSGSPPPYSLSPVVVFDGCWTAVLPIVLPTPTTRGQGSLSHHPQTAPPD
jgi:hypothetical protein